MSWTLGRIWTIQRECVFKMLESRLSGLWPVKLTLRPCYQPVSKVAHRNSHTFWSQKARRARWHRGGGFLTLPNLSNGCNVEEKIFVLRLKWHTNVGVCSITTNVLLQKLVVVVLKIRPLCSIINITEEYSLRRLHAFNSPLLQLWIHTFYHWTLSEKVTLVIRAATRGIDKRCIYL